MFLLYAVVDSCCTRRNADRASTTHRGSRIVAGRCDITMYIERAAEAALAA